MKRMKVRDLEADNIDLIQDYTEAKEFLESAGYVNDDYNFVFVVWDKERKGDLKEVYGSYSANLDAEAYRCEEK